MRLTGLLTRYQNLRLCVSPGRYIDDAEEHRRGGMSAGRRRAVWLSRFIQSRALLTVVVPDVRQSAPCCHPVVGTQNASGHYRATIWGYKQSSGEILMPVENNH